MNLIIDIGNTRAKLFTFSGEQLVDYTTCNHDLAELPHFIEKNNCKHGILSTTSGLTKEAEQHIEMLPFKVLHMTGTTPTPVNILYHTPHTLGTDRLAAIVAAQDIKPECDILVIDCGTCVTYDFLDAQGNYWGGNISPGLEMRLKAMHQLTARLPIVNSEGDLPEVGYDTQTAIRNGAIWGLRHEIDGYIRQFQKKFNALSVFLTGGDAKKLGMSEESCIFAGAKIGYSSEKAEQDLAFRSDCTIFVDDFVVPRGLNLILNYNK